MVVLAVPSGRGTGRRAATCDFFQKLWDSDNVFATTLIPIEARGISFVKLRIINNKSDVHLKAFKQERNNVSSLVKGRAVRKSSCTNRVSAALCKSLARLGI